MLRCFSSICRLSVLLLSRKVFSNSSSSLSPRSILSALVASSMTLLSFRHHSRQSTTTSASAVAREEGVATKAGQKKTNNFDACQDMSGRRLRHVNAEEKLEDWRAKEDERRLGKIAEDLIRKAVKKGKKGLDEEEAQKYVEKYREESAKCVAQVEISVRDAIGFYMTFRRNLKRKGGEDAGLDGKKLKIW